MTEFKKQTIRFYNKKAKDHYFETVNIYELDNFTSYEFWIVARYLNKAINNVSRNYIICDIGTGTDTYIILLKKLGFHMVIGADLSSGMLKIAKSKGIQYLVQCDANFLPFQNESFHLVTSFALLEHVPKPEKVIKELYRVSHKAGYLFLMTPNPIFFNAFRIRNKPQKSQYEKFIFPEQLRSFLDRNAQVLNFSTCYIIPPLMPLIFAFIGKINRKLLYYCLFLYMLFEIRILQKLPLLNRLGYLQLLYYTRLCDSIQ